MAVTTTNELKPVLKLNFLLILQSHLLQKKTLHAVITSIALLMRVAKWVKNSFK